jgi:hypothetical protein
MNVSPAYGHRRSTELRLPCALRGDLFANCRARGEPAEGLADLVPSALTGTFAPNTVTGSFIEVIASRGPESPLTNACSASVRRARVGVGSGPVHSWSPQGRMLGSLDSGAQTVSHQDCQLSRFSPDQRGPTTEWSAGLMPPLRWSAGTRSYRLPPNRASFAIRRSKSGKPGRCCHAAGPENASQAGPRRLRRGTGLKRARAGVRLVPLNSSLRSASTFQTTLPCVSQKARLLVAIDRLFSFRLHTALAFRWPVGLRSGH